MCGIVGGWWKDKDIDVASIMRDSINKLKHRGPDDNDYIIYNLPNGTLALGNTRLSIIDLSPLGHQPMISSDGRYTLIYNGELYNYIEIRNDLIALGHSFKSSSDTEVLLKSWEVWGSNCLKRFIGMFAFTIYDSINLKITCARDAFGIKPLYYDSNSDHFLFSSELPALLTIKKEYPKVDLQRSYDYLVHGDYDNQEKTFIENVRHLLPSHLIEIDLHSGKPHNPCQWWNPSIENTSSLNFNNAAESLREQFLQNVRLHMRSDVSLGVTLSGGIDSSSIACAMRYIDPHANIKTFSYVSSDPRISEEPWIDIINEHIDSKSYKAHISSDDILQDLSNMIAAQGEPFGGTSIYAQYRVFQLVKDKGVTVCLDGQGGDELLAGYNGYPGQRLYSLMETYHPISALMFSYNWSKWPDRQYIKSWMHLANLSLPDFLHKYAWKLAGRDSMPKWLNTDFLNDSGVFLSLPRPPLPPSIIGRRVTAELKQSLIRNGLAQLLRHGDRNSMHFSVESRVPFLSIPNVELILSLPEEYLISPRGETKSIFRSSMRGIVPDNILDRRNKIGFATPEKELLMPIVPTIRSWLESGNNIPFINMDVLLKHFDSYASGKQPYSLQVWRWINYIKWYNMTIPD